MDTDTNTRNSTGANHGSIVPEVYLEGLSLDAFILDALLKRHRCSHGRTIYFRRMKMVLNRLMLRREGGAADVSKPKKETVVEDALYRLADLQKTINGYQQEQKRKRASRKRRHNNNEEEEEQWDLQSIHSLSPSSKSGLIGQEFQDLISIWIGIIPEILSKIHHASKALFTEVSRGFFLPFCTIALGALARIRALLMEIGLRGLTTIRDLSDEVSEILSRSNSSNTTSKKPMLTTTDYERCTNLFLENEGDIDRKSKLLLQHDPSRKKNVHFDQGAILRSLGLTESTKTANSKTVGTPKGDGPTIVNNDNDANAKREHDPFASEPPPPVDDYYTLESSAPLQQRLGSDEMDDDRNVSEMDDHLTTTGTPRESLDRNMALVDRFQKRKRNEKQSKKKDTNATIQKYVQKSESDDDPAVERERKNTKRKSSDKARKDSAKTKKKKKKPKKAKSDFFDQLFD